MADRNDLIVRALRNLGALPQGQSPSAEEYQSINDILDWVIADLTNRNIIFNVNADYPEDEFVLPLGDIVAWKAASEFGQDRNAKLAGMATLAEQQLKETYNRLYRDDVNHRTMRTDYYPTCRTPYNWTNG